MTDVELVTIGQQAVRVPSHAAADWRNAASGDWEAATVKAIVEHVNEGSVVVDVGAYIGVISGVALLRGATVHAYEPDPVALRALRAFGEANPELSRRLAIHDIALGVADGRLELSSNELGNSGSSLVRRGVQRTEVEVADVGRLVTEPPFTECDLLKMDVEGLEYDLMPRMWDFLLRQGSVLLLSTHTYPFREPYLSWPRLVRGVLYRIIAPARQLRLLPRLAQLGEVQIDAAGCWKPVSRLRLVRLACRVGEKEFLVVPRPPSV